VNLRVVAIALLVVVALLVDYMIGNGNDGSSTTVIQRHFNEDSGSGQTELERSKTKRSTNPWKRSKKKSESRRRRSDAAGSRLKTRRRRRSRRFVRRFSVKHPRTGAVPCGFA
jgi:hypothetical protein